VKAVVASEDSGRSEHSAPGERTATTTELAPGRARNWPTIIGLVVSVLLLVGLYSRVDLGAVWAALRGGNLTWAMLSVGAIIPITLLLALRFYWVAPQGGLPSYLEALRLTLVTIAFNMFLPSKSGDLVKSYFVAKRSEVRTGTALSIIVYERLCDLFGLIACCLVGWVIRPPYEEGIPSAGWVLIAGVGGLCLVLLASERSAGWLYQAVHYVLPSQRLPRLNKIAAGWPELHAALRGRRARVLILSIALWVGHMAQMWLFTFAVSASLPFTTSLSLFALALLAGQLPLTFAGFGARDIALVVLLSGHMPAASAAAVGLLSATRGFIPSLAAVPIARPYLAVLAQEAGRLRPSVAAQA
jgi:uncharacterized protein (TIRG00374 family)